MDPPIVGCLVGRIVEHLKELGAPQMEHELREQAELLGETERPRIILVVFAESLDLKSPIGLS